MNTNLNMVAQVNFHALGNIADPGCGLVVGRNTLGNLIQVCWILDRGSESRDKVLRSEGGRIFTNPTKGDASAPIYNVMDDNRSWHVVSNGHHTNTLVRCLSTKGNEDGITKAVNELEHQPDEPISTPRIAGICSRASNNKHQFQILIIKRSPWESGCERGVFKYEKIGDGFGYCIHTYSGASSSIEPRPFDRAPYLVPLDGDEVTIGTSFKETLPQDHFVSLAVKLFPFDLGKPPRIHIINKY